MPKREEWENNNTKEILKNYGNKNFKYTELKENKNGQREHKKNRKKHSNNKLLLKKKKDFYKSTKIS